MSRCGFLFGAIIALPSIESIEYEMDLRGCVTEFVI